MTNGEEQRRQLIAITPAGGGANNTRSMSISWLRALSSLVAHADSRKDGALQRPFTEWAR